jgi:hypothetical protein
MWNTSNRARAGRMGRARAALLIAAAATAMAALAGCASTVTSSEPSPPASLQPVNGSSVPNVVLTPVGAQRIGVQTAAVQPGGGGEATFPYAALLYEANGTTAVYVANGKLTYTRHLVQVDTITGTQVSVKSGVTPGMQVVTAGAEELLGVQNGVGEET